MMKLEHLCRTFARGCLPDYLALLARAPFPFNTAVRERFEAHRQEKGSASDQFKEIFTDCQLPHLAILLNTFYPQTKVR